MKFGAFDNRSDRSTTDGETIRPAGARVAAFLFLVVVAANAASFPFIGTGPWWSSARFWLGRAAILITAGVGVWSIQGREHRRRARGLELAVAERTQALERERVRALERNRILEMLVSNQPVATVLGAIINLVRQHSPDAQGALVGKCGDRSEILAAPELSPEWREALAAQHAVPFEAWRKHFETAQPASHPAWEVFIGGIDGPRPAMIESWPIGSDEAPLAVLLVFHGSISQGDPGVADDACLVARLALERNRLNEDLRFQARHDSLTRLPNRTQYEELLEQSMQAAKPKGRGPAVLYIDLDNFRRINDAFSHSVGDLMLCEIAHRMTAALGPRDVVARIGSDEFTIVLNDVEDGAEAARIAALVLGAIRQPLVIDGNRVETSASAGIAIYPEDGGDLRQLERAADAAMRHAKDLGRDRAEAFATRNETLDRARMEEEMRLGLRNGWFVVHYQAKVGADRKVVGFEALLRLNHPEHGLIPPMNFIPIAEANGMIVPLGNWVLDEVCRQMADWEKRGLGPVPVAVNVSPAQICRPDFARSVEECLARHGVSAWHLELELTEGLLINPTEMVQSQLQELRGLGVQLSIDDFGTGYSSLSYLHRLRIDSIKLDRSFVQSIDTDEMGRKLVRAMVGVAQGLGLSIVGEGVETEAQRTTLLGAGCRVMQGYLFARPQPASELEDLLRGSEWNTARNSDRPDSADLAELSASLLNGKDHVAEGFVN